VSISNPKDGVKYSHLGRWNSKLVDGRDISLILDNNGYAKFVINDKLYKPNDYTNSTVYVIDYNANPVTLDIVYISKTRPSSVIRMVVEFLSPEIIRVATNFNDIRPSNFKDSDFFLMRKSLF